MFIAFEGTVQLKLNPKSLRYYGNVISFKDELKLPLND